MELRVETVTPDSYTRVRVKLSREESERWSEAARHLGNPNPGRPKYFSVVFENVGAQSFEVKD